MPGANPAEDAALARRITERILASAPTVLVSYAQHAAEGTQRPSSTLHGLTQTPSQTIREAEDLLFPIPLEAIDDNPTLPPPPDIVLRGGANLLKLQAACGFRAFAEQRLSATALDTAEPGMDARERGTIVHLALEHFWQEIKDQATLRALTTEARREALDRAIAAALQKAENIAASDWDNAYLDVQRQRLRDLLDPWLLAELGRTVPFTVRLQETELTDARIGPLRLTLRVDRIDSTEFGDVILDYKTGEARPAAWLTDRPDEPQLPLYAILSPDPEHLAGIAFAQVRPGKDRNLTGYQTQSGILLKETKLKTATLTAQLEDWHRILTQLAEDFHHGDLRVRPKQYPHTCEYCAQRILCRLDITTLEDHSPDDSDEEQESNA
jgi:probable DNA repair protein